VAFGSGVGVEVGVGVEIGVGVGDGVDVEVGVLVASDGSERLDVLRSSMGAGRTSR
jgi:hypothetical protein